MQEKLKELLKDLKQNRAAMCDAYGCSCESNVRDMQDFLEELIEILVEGEDISVLVKQVFS